MIERNTICLLVGESGSGKDTIAQQLRMHYGMKQLRSYTTREPRYEGEESHVFVKSFEQWQRENADDSIVAYTKFDGHDYWASSDQVDNHDIYIIDPDGIRYFQRCYHGDKRVVVVYVAASRRERLRRMLSRGDGLLTAIRRLMHDESAFRGVEAMADYIVCNDEPSDLLDCVNEVATYLRF